MLNNLLYSFPERKKVVAWNNLTSRTPVLVLFLSIIIILTSTMDAANTESLKAVAASNLKFTNAIYQILAKQEGNVFFSPISIEVILALTYLGARGNTAKQMAAGLRLPADDNTVKDGFHAMLSSLKSDGKITLDIANKLFPDQTFKMKDEFVAIAQKSFLADAETVDFQRATEAARLLINKWVEGKTNNRIKDLLAPGILDASTALVLVNAVYFKGDWASKFDPNNTKKAQFYLTNTETTEVDMMYRKDNFGYAYREELDCKVLELPYAGNKLSMVILLPGETEGLAKLEAKLPEIDLPKLLSELGKPKVEVWLPKFKMDQFTNLKPVLKELGMVDMFDNADLSGIADGPLAVSEVVHKAFIEVNEEGSEAAAATAGVMRLKRSLGSMEPIVFLADRPFVFFICEAGSRHVLFSGRLRDAGGGVSSMHRDEL